MLQRYSWPGDIRELRSVVERAVLLASGTHVEIPEELLREGRHVGGYTLQRQLGQGGMGEVWLAQHSLLARPSAVKLIRQSAMQQDAGARQKLEERFQREAKATAQLRSPNTVELYDFGMTDDGEVTLLSPKWFERAGEIFTEHLSQADVEIVHYLQTNLIDYDRSWNPLVYQMFGGSLGTSLDYPNLYRRPIGRQAADFFPRWRQGYDEAREGGVHVGVIAVVNHTTLTTGAEAFYHFFVDELGIDDFQVNTPFFARNQADSLEPLDPAALGAFLVDLADVWLAEGRARSVKLGPFDELLNCFAGREGVLPCMWRPSCPHDLVSIDPDGNVAQCDCWVSSYPEARSSSPRSDCSVGVAIADPPS